MAAPLALSIRSRWEKCTSSRLRPCFPRGSWTTLACGIGWILAIRNSHIRHEHPCSLRSATMTRLALGAALLATLALAAPAQAAAPWMDRTLSPDRRADLLAAQMLLPEKVNLVTGVSGCAGRGSDGFVLGSARLGLPDLEIVGAGMGVSGICPNRANGGKATELPAPI